MIKENINGKKTNTTKHTRNENFCKKNLCKSNSYAGLPQVKNSKIPYFKIGLLFIICLAMSIALIACTVSIPLNEFPDNESADNDSADRESSDNESADRDSTDNESADNESADNDSSDNESADNDSSPSSIEYTLKTGELAKFVSTWRTESTIALPLVENGRYDFTVDWGDEKTDTITRWDADEKTHTYDQSGTYEVTITGTIVGWAFGYKNSNTLKLTAVSQWGNLHLGNTAGYQFYGARNLNITASDSPFLHDGDTTYTTDLKYAFARATKLSTSGNLNNWNVANVTNMERMFNGANAFNQPIGNWNVDNVTNMERMFSSAVKFNQDINQWDVGNVTTMQGMFSGANAFNQPIGNWNVDNVTNMRWLFTGAQAFNQPISQWKVGKVTDMSSMFNRAVAFNQPIGNWNVSRVAIMSGMFYGATTFNQPIGGWDVGNVTNMLWMFKSAKAFDQPIGNWNVANVTSMMEMFNRADAFNQPIGNWNVANVIYCSGFAGNSTLAASNMPTFTSCNP